MLEEVMPPLSFLGEAHLFLFPIVFSFTALTLSFLEALFFGILTGCLVGLMVVHFQAGIAEISLGWFIFFFLIWAFLLQLFREFTHGIRWELHTLASGFCTMTFLAGEFFLLSFYRGDFFINGSFFLFSFLPAALVLILAPLLYGLLELLFSLFRKTSSHYPAPY